MDAHSLDGACDCHIHIYEDSYPLAPSATFRPPPAPVASYRQVQASLGLTRVIVVQPTGYGFDNRCTLSALAQLGNTARGIVAVPPTVTDAELERLHEAGVRGIRYMMIPGGGGLMQWDSLEEMAARIAPLNWTINLQLDGRDIPQYEATLRRLPGRLVIDHTGKFLEPVRTDNEAFMALRRVLERNQCWIKLSAPYETSRSGPPHYEDVSILARALTRHYPERCLWASNWPHPNANPAPSNIRLLDWLTDCAGSDSVTRKILIDNPAGLYGF
ncbi:amidohydrolase family protein [Paraburkholderia agricolaris]|uniref:amidohydrolase family protein n=1 Tax=Paraburkholderia agricolaris TaxID=2152888 RepID=UPI0038BCE226